MPAPTIYRSTDPGAPVLMGVGGSLVDVLTACLVDGYGGSFATGVITNDGVLLTDGDTVTIGSITYTYRTSLTGQPAYAFTGATVAGMLGSLVNAINGNGIVGTNYSAGTLAHPDAYTTTVSVPAPIAISSRRAGTPGNSIALSENSTHLTVSGANLTGGSGSITKTGAGWTRPFTGAGGQAVYRPPAGSRFYLQVDDTGPGGGGARDARNFGWENATAWNTGTGQFPTAAQATAGSVIRKSSTLDATARAWTLLVDDRTFYLFTYSGDSAGLAHGFSFGDFYSFLPGDLYKCLIMGGSSESGSLVTSTQFFQHPTVGLAISHAGHWLPRNYSGAGGSTVFLKAGDQATGATTIAGTLGFPNPCDGGLYVAPLRIFDGSTPASSITGTINMRGRLRGLYQAMHAVGSFADGDTFSGVGDYAGRNFMIVKGTQTGAFVAVETTAWDVST